VTKVGWIWKETSISAAMYSLPLGLGKKCEIRAGFEKKKKKETPTTAARTRLISRLLQETQHAETLGEKSAWAFYICPSWERNAAAEAEAALEGKGLSAKTAVIQRGKSSNEQGGRNSIRPSCRGAASTAMSRKSKGFSGMGAINR